MSYKTYIWFKIIQKHNVWKISAHFDLNVFQKGWGKIIFNTVLEINYLSAGNVSQVIVVEINLYLEGPVSSESVAWT